MANTSTLRNDQRKLLERLYNLKSDDSDVISNIRQSISANEETGQRIQTEKEDCENQKSSKTDRKVQIENQYQKFLDDLKGISKDSYTVLLEEAEESFDPEAMLERIKERIPKRLEEIETLITSLEEKIAASENALSENSLTAQELEEKLADAERVRADLAKLIDESLHGNGSITRDSVEEILAKLGFKEEEIIELGKMILFPQGTLESFDAEYQERKTEGHTVPEILGARPEEPTAEPTPESEPIKVVGSEPTGAAEPNTTPSEDASVEKVTETPETAPEAADYSEFYEQTGIQPGFLSEQAVAELSAVNKPQLIKENYATLTSLEISDTNIKTYYSALIDPDLNGKIKLFQELGKTSIDMNLNFPTLLVYSLADLEELKTLCEESDLSLGNIPLNVLGNGLTDFFENLATLSGSHTELDGSEVTKRAALLATASSQFKNNLNMLNKYAYSLTKKNGKTALQPLAQDSTELATGLDAVIETGEDRIFDNEPDKLAINLMDLANRIAYCHKNAIPLYNESGAPHHFIFDEAEFAKVFEPLDPETIKEIPTAEEARGSLQETTNNSSLIDLLDKMDLTTLYETGRNITDEEVYFGLQSYLGQLAEYENETHRAYIIDGVTLSKERTERNLVQLIKNPTDGKAEEILVVALLYGALKSKEDMVKVANAMGFSEPSVEGSVRL